MSFHVFKCQDKLIKELTRTFNATPLLVPDTETLPLQVVAHRGRNTALWGPIGPLFMDSGQFNVKVGQAQLADINVSKTNSYSTGFGLKILKNFLEGFNIKSDPVELALKRVNKISFSFKEVKKKYIPITTLGEAILPMRINTKNPAFKVFIPEKGKSVYDMYLINSVLTCSGFDINFDEQQDHQLGLDIPILDQLSDLGLTARMESNQARGLSFNGKKPLTFAFTCIELDISQEGEISFGQQVILEKGVGEDGGIIEEHIPEEVSLISEELPALMSWNKRDFIQQSYENF